MTQQWVHCPIVNAFRMANKMKEEMQKAIEKNDL